MNKAFTAGRATKPLIRLCFGVFGNRNGGSLRCFVSRTRRCTCVATLTIELPAPGRERPAHPRPSLVSAGRRGSFRAATVQARDEQHAAATPAGNDRCQRGPPSHDYASRCSRGTPARSCATADAALRTGEHWSLCVLVSGVARSGSRCDRCQLYYTQTIALFYSSTRTRETHLGVREYHA